MLNDNDNDNDIQNSSFFKLEATKLKGGPSN